MNICANPLSPPVRDARCGSMNCSILRYKRMIGGRLESDLRHEAGASNHNEGAVGEQVELALIVQVDRRSKFVEAVEYKQKLLLKQQLY